MAFRKLEKSEFKLQGSPVIVGKVSAQIGYHEGSTTPVIDVKTLNLDGKWQFLARKGVRFWQEIALVTANQGDLFDALFADGGAVSQVNAAENAREEAKGNAIREAWTAYLALKKTPEQAMKLLCVEYQESEIKAALTVVRGQPAAAQE